MPHPGVIRIAGIFFFLWADATGKHTWQKKIFVEDEENLVQEEISGEFAFFIKISWLLMNHSWLWY